MRTTISIIGIIIGCFIASGELNQIFDPSTIWYKDNGNPEPHERYAESYGVKYNRYWSFYIIGDTCVNNHKYHILESSSEDGLTKGSRSYYRVDGKRVYFLYKRTGQEFLVYDFGVFVEDEIKVADGKKVSNNDTFGWYNLRCDRIVYGINDSGETIKLLYFNKKPITDLWGLGEREWDERYETVWMYGLGGYNRPTSNNEYEWVGVRGYINKVEVNGKSYDTDFKEIFSIKRWPKAFGRDRKGICISANLERIHLLNSQNATEK